MLDQRNEHSYTASNTTQIWTPSVFQVQHLEFGEAQDLNTEIRADDFSCKQRHYQLGEVSTHIHPRPDAD